MLMCYSIYFNFRLSVLHSAKEKIIIRKVDEECKIKNAYFTLEKQQECDKRFRAQ